jgi:hypothetical protein
MPSVIHSSNGVQTSGHLQLPRPPVQSSRTTAVTTASATPSAIDIINKFYSLPQSDTPLPTSTAVTKPPPTIPVVGFANIGTPTDEDSEAVQRPLSRNVLSRQHMISSGPGTAYNTMDGAAGRRGVDRSGMSLLQMVIADAAVNRERESKSRAKSSDAVKAPVKSESSGAPSVTGDKLDSLTNELKVVTAAPVFVFPPARSEVVATKAIAPKSSANDSSVDHFPLPASTDANQVSAAATTSSLGVKPIISAPGGSILKKFAGSIGFDSRGKSKTVSVNVNAEQASNAATGATEGSEKLSSMEKFASDLRDSAMSLDGLSGADSILNSRLGKRTKSGNDVLSSDNTLHEPLVRTNTQNTVTVNTTSNKLLGATPLAHRPGSASKLLDTQRTNRELLSSHGVRAGSDSINHTVSVLK